MNDSQSLTPGALGQQMSSDGVELTSLTSVSSRATNDDQVSALDRHKLDTSSSAALHWPLDSEEFELAGQAPLQPSHNTQPHSGSPTSLKRRSALQRIGVQTVATLVASVILTTAVIGFLTFFWTAPHDNTFWRAIIVEGWAGRAVTVSSLILRTAIDFQAGVAVAMLAAILLETDYHLLFIDTAQVSKLRAGRAAPMDIAIPHIRAIRYEWPRDLGGYLQISVVLLLVVTTLLLQVTSTMLVSDLSLGVLPGAPSSEDLRFDFTYEWKSTGWQYPYQRRAVSPWLRNPPAFPTFAEFSEPIDVPEHVDDTGSMFRAFLPFQNAQYRETISQYSGKALVLDARVSCQPPQLQKLHIDTNGSRFSYVGAFSKTHDVPDLLGPVSSVPFNCPFSVYGHQSSFSVCQPSGYNGDGKLLSKLRDVNQWLAVADRWGKGSLGPDGSPGAAHLIFNTTWGQFYDESKNVATNVSTASGHGAWTDVSYLSSVPGSYFNLSVTLCYPAIWTARLNVTMNSASNRTEPSVSSFDTYFRTTPDIHVQMGEFKQNATLESRGVLSLAPKASWLPDPVDVVQFGITKPESYADGDAETHVVSKSFIVDSAKIPTELDILPDYEGSNASLSWGFPGFDSRHIEIESSIASPDLTIASIFTTSLEVTNGSAATALSTIITVMASMAYYDQFPNFAETAHDVSTAYFQTFLFPQSFRGLGAVLVITAVHLLLIMVIAATFLTSTRLTTLGDHWQSISQVVSPATESFLAESSHATDKEIRRCLKAEHREKETVLIQPLVVEGEARIGVVARRAHRRSSDGR